MRKLISRCWYLLLFVFLTVLTQVGGLVLLLSSFASKKIRKPFRGKAFLVFAGFYMITTFLVVPLVAPIFGREKVAHISGVRPTNYLTVILNRNYVRPDMNKVLQSAAAELHPTDITINYLDANFPFVNGFPLLPHLSHNDGKKLDISLVYQTPKGTITSAQKSFSGYGVFVEPLPGERKQTERCLQAGHSQYNLTRLTHFGRINKTLAFSEQGTKHLLAAFLKSREVSKIFIEPHLKQRLGLTSSRIRFHGCQAVRHDDHIHVQLR